MAMDTGWVFVRLAALEDRRSEFTGNDRANS